MSWTWAFECDFQLFLIVPFFVIIYKKAGKVAGVVAAILTMAAGWYIAWSVAYYYQLTISVMSL